MQSIFNPHKAATGFVRNEKNMLPHKPKDTVNFLKLFDSSKGIKYLTHDANALDFTRESLLKIVKEEFEDAKKQYVIPVSLDNLFYQFVFSPNPRWFTWETGKEEVIRLGWSSKEIVDWCNEEVNKNKHPQL